MTETTNSMTAFARVEASGDNGEYAWELRSVNHRYLDISLRLPDDMRRFESQFRERISARVKRGRIDASLRIKMPTDGATAAELDPQAARRLAGLADDLAKLVPGLGSLRSIDVLGWPGVVRQPVVEADAIGAEAVEHLDAALADLVATRRREGGKLAAMIRERLVNAEKVVDSVRTLQPEFAALYRNRLSERLGELTDKVDPERLEQELVLFLQRSDIDEEIDRLTTHIDEVRRVLAVNEAKGRRLDFLMQELNREANTLGSKSTDARLTAASVDLKVFIEQMREQIQNIE